MPVRPEKVPAYMHSRFGLALFLSLSAAVVFWPIASGHYTLSQNPWSTDLSRRYLGPDLPVWDPAAGAYQDEPWLHLIRAGLREGRLTLVNLRNGLGAPMLESMQSGPLYVLNPLLLLTWGGGPGFFDAFCLLHVALLVLGLFVLLRLYARDVIAAGTALLVGFSGFTYHSVNMVHFRSFAWAPLLTAGAVMLARGGSAGSVALLAVGALGAGTAGSLQDFALTVGTAAVLAGVEAARDVAGRGGSRLAIVFGALLACAALVAPTYLPYLLSNARGNLASVAHAQRCLGSTPGPLFWTWVLPRVNGTHAEMLTPLFHHDQQPDFTTVGFFILCVAVVIAWRSPLPAGRRPVLLASLGLLALLLAKAANLPPLGLCARIPFVSEIRFTKYVLQEALVAGIAMAIAGERLAEADARDRRRLMAGGAVLFAVFVTGLALHVTGRGWTAPVPGAPRARLVAVWSCSAAVLVAWLWLSARARPAWWCALPLFLLQAMVLLPAGYAGSVAHRVPSVAGLLDHAVQRDARVVSTMTANSNLFFGFEDVGVFDPVSPRALGRALAEGALEPWQPPFHLQFSVEPSALTPRQLAALRLISVDLIETHGPIQRPFRPALPGLAALDGTLPKAFVVRPATFAEADRLCRAGDLAGAVRVLSERGDPIEPLAARREGNAIALVSATRTEGMLVLVRAFSSAWSLGRQSPASFCDLFPAWRVSFAPGERAVASYRPPGLRVAIAVALTAALALAGLAAIARRRPLATVLP